MVIDKMIIKPFFSEWEIPPFGHLCVAVEVAEQLTCDAGSRHNVSERQSCKLYSTGLAATGQKGNKKRNMTLRRGGVGAYFPAIESSLAER